MHLIANRWSKVKIKKKQHHNPFRTFIFFLFLLHFFYDDELYNPPFKWNCLYVYCKWMEYKNWIFFYFCNDGAKNKRKTHLDRNLFKIQRRLDFFRWSYFGCKVFLCAHFKVLILEIKIMWTFCLKLSFCWFKLKVLKFYIFNILYPEFQRFIVWGF